MSTEKSFDCKVGDRVCVSLKTLWDSKITSGNPISTNDDGNEVVHTDVGYDLAHSVENGNDYYDLEAGGDPHACGDGETCSVVAVDDTRITLSSEYGGTHFDLSLDEYGTAVFA